jgi:hypothetical protein
MKKKLIFAASIFLLLSAFIIYRSFGGFFEATRAFRIYCDSHQVQFDSFRGVESGSRLGYTFMNFHSIDPSQNLIFRVSIPWIGGPKVEKSDQQN